jgi:putative phosphoesterase
VAELRRAELILHAGDLTSAAFLDELRSYGPPVLAVHGNADEPALQETLPARLVTEVGRVRIGLTHDGGPRAGREARLSARFPGCAAIVYGHSHVPELTRAGAVWILNPGSPTDRRRRPDFTMIVARVSGARFVPKLLHFAA